MAGIVGILKNGEKILVKSMLDKISHRGNYSKKIMELDGATIGIVWSFHEDNLVTRNLEQDIFIDGPGFGHRVSVYRTDGLWYLRRDELGLSPMYYAKSANGDLCFASEVKALLQISKEISELLPGHLININTIERYYSLEKMASSVKDQELITSDLLHLLSISVARRISSDTIGSWLSGGLDSSTIAVLARPWVKSLHTFAGGLKFAPDFDAAMEVARFIGSRHHEIVITPEEMIRTLPKLIYHLESFDALLVRSSIINFLVSQFASGFVGEVFSGEGGDEFFAGYHYLKSIPEERLSDELIDISKRLHNTALQRVDRCASSTGTRAHVIFADPDVFEYALKIPVSLKLKNGVEKWILRQAMEGILPPGIVNRPKSKFWEGAGVGDILSDYANSIVTDHDFQKERTLKNGWVLNTKEELYYYRIFRDAFGDLEKLDWMGRTKGSPIS
jgi:asparagine synthase (glutamine-hydrolysing)